VSDALIYNGATNVGSFLALDEDDIKELYFPVEDYGTQRINLVERKKLIALRRWAYHQGENGQNLEAWNALTVEQYQAFLNNPQLNRAPIFGNAQQQQPVVMPADAPIVTPRAASAVESFQKGIKRDHKDYMTFDDQSKYLLWRRQVITTARSHGVYNVLDGKYEPADEEAK
jgi:hypothetical protein